MHLPLKPSTNEQNYFGYAGSLFQKVALTSGSPSKFLSAVRCFVCAGHYGPAAELCSKLPPSSFQDGKILKQLNSIINLSGLANTEPEAVFQESMANGQKDCSLLIESVNRMAKIGCRSLYGKDDDAFSATLGLLSSRTDRIQLLKSLVLNADSGGFLCLFLLYEMMHTD